MAMSHGWTKIVDKYAGTSRELSLQVKNFELLKLFWSSQIGEQLELACRSASDTPVKALGREASNCFILVRHPGNLQGSGRLVQKSPPVRHWR